LGHLEIAGFDMYRGLPNHEGLTASLFDRFDLVMSGHYHHKSRKGPIQYLGAPYAMTWSDYADQRGFHLFDTDTRTLEFIENPYSLFGRIIYDDKDQGQDYIHSLCQVILDPYSVYRNGYVKVVVKTKENPTWFDLMIETLHQVNAQEVIVIDDIIVDDTEGPEESQDVDTLTLIDDYVGKLSLNCPKEDLKKYMRETYKRALEASHAARLT